MMNDGCVSRRWMDARADNWSQTEPHDATTDGLRTARRRGKREPLDIATARHRDDDDNADHRRRSIAVVGWENSREFTQSTNHSDRSV